ncbi:MAG TPA: cytochrome c [Burkholderiales bacterium]|nr:cytochrome c [Burkholderiales bacterium]
MFAERARSAFALSLMLIALETPGADGPDAARGRLLYEQHCISCHAPGIHGRTTRTPLTRDELRMLVDTFRRQANLGWTRQEIDDVVEHLSIMTYRFPPEK